MIQMDAFLTFNGNCREAMMFYKACLGGELTLQTIGDSPLSEKMPKQMKDCILHATLVRDALVLKGSDMVSSKGLIKGNAISISLHCESLEQIQTYFEKLSKGGNIQQPLEHNYWGDLTGTIIDKYGNQWFLNYKK